DALREDPPRVPGRMSVLPDRAGHLAEVVGLLEPDAVRAEADPQVRGEAPGLLAWSGGRRHASTPSRSGRLYTLQRSPRRKPTSVMPSRDAVSTARSVGAPTAATTGMPAAAAFWTSSKLTRPLSSSSV